MSFDSPGAPLALGRMNGTAVAAPDKAERKAHGIHYTPPLLAAYLARQVVAALKIRAGRTGRINVLDPACGAGELLKALFEAVPATWRDRLSLTGFDKDEQALATAKGVLSGLGAASVNLQRADFLSVVSQSDGQMSLLLTPAHGEERRLVAQFDAVISNPPYVRTQVLGAAAARELTARFGLSGRVDLYHAFVKAMTLALREDGILGLLTSNRFLTVQSGSSMREWLFKNFHLLRLVDLGDTKLFEAAVLPAILIARRNVSGRSEPDEKADNPLTPALSPSEGERVPAGRVTGWTGSSEREHPQECEFVRVYEAGAKLDTAAREADSVLDVIDGSFSGQVRVNSGCFQVETGRLLTGADSRTPWSMTNRGIESWLATMRAHSAGTFADVAKVCVGIKTTADSIFIRDDWKSLLEGERPEEELLHPLVTHHFAARWHLPASVSGIKRVLYPYVMNADERVPVDLADYPCARNYLLKHRERLEGRSYVIESGRQWYELWVPHRPRDWMLPKLAFPDISETNRFFLVEEGWIVNGDCYWAKLLPGKDASWLMLMLAVANSSFALKFYDAVFHNKLYAGRRRFMSQYVSRFPLPKLSRATDILDLMPRLLAASAKKAPELSQLAREMDGLIWKAFGLPEEVTR